MYIYRDFVTDEALAPQKKKILRKLWLNAGMLGIYIITLSSGSDMFDIIHTGILKQRRYPKKDIYMLGMAKGKDSAALLCGELFESFRRQYGSDCFVEELKRDRERLFKRF